MWKIPVMDPLNFSAVFGQVEGNQAEFRPQSISVNPTNITTVQFSNSGGDLSRKRIRDSKEQEKGETQEPLSKISRKLTLTLFGSFETLPEEVTTHILSYLGNDIVSVFQLNSYWNKLVLTEVRRAELHRLCKLIQEISGQDALKKGYPEIVDELEKLSETIDIGKLIQEEKFDIKEFLTTQQSKLIDILKKISIFDLIYLNIGEMKPRLCFSNFINLLTLESILNAVDGYRKYYRTHRHLLGNPQTCEEFYKDVEDNTQAYSLYVVFGEDSGGFLEEPHFKEFLKEYFSVSFNKFHSFIQEKFKKNFTVNYDDRSLDFDEICADILYLKIMYFLVSSKQHFKASKIFLDDINGFDETLLIDWVEEVRELNELDSFLESIRNQFSSEEEFCLWIQNWWDIFT